MIQTIAEKTSRDLQPGSGLPRKRRRKGNKMARFYPLARCPAICSIVLLVLAAAPPGEAAEDGRAATVLDLADFGARPDSGEDAVPAVRAAVEAASRVEGAVTLRLPRGRYDFRPEQAARRDLFISNHSDPNPKNLAFFLDGFRDLVVDGQGSLLVFHGRMLPFTIVNCERVTVRRLSIDWERPTHSQADVVRRGDGCFDLRFDPQYRYAIEEGRIVFVGDGWRCTDWAVQPHDGRTGRIVYRTGDSGIGNGQTLGKLPARELKAGLVRFEGSLPERVRPGDVLVIRHNDRDHPGFFVCSSRDTVLEDLGLHHACAMGVLAQRCENVTLRRILVAPRIGSGRRFTTVADATHFSGCKGTILVEGCRFEGMLDDAVNVHGTCLRICEIVPPRTVKAEYVHHMSKGFDVAGPGDTIQAVRRDTLLPCARLTVESVKRLDERTAVFRFEEDLPAGPALGDGLENLTWTPEVVFRGNVIRNNRARGMLFNTPRRTVVEENIVCTSGSAVLVAGDANYWFESGAVADLLIRGNIFENCLTNLYQFTHAVISIDPEIPRHIEGGHAYHRNIRIEGNIIRTFDAPVLYAEAVEGLTFESNIVQRTRDFEPFHPNGHAIRLHSCRAVRILGSLLGDGVVDRSVVLENMNPAEVTVGPGQDFEKPRLLEPR